MLQDHVRTTTYQSAFFQNYMDFAGKVRECRWSGEWVKLLTVCADDVWFDFCFSNALTATYEH